MNWRNMIGLSALNAKVVEKQSMAKIPVPDAKDLRLYGLTLESSIILISSLIAQRENFRVRYGTLSKIKPENLRPEVVQNLKSPPRPYSHSGYKGVITRRKGYLVRVWTIDYPHKKYIGGNFSCPMEAARCYDEYMLQNVGDWVYLNFGHEREDSEGKSATLP